MFSYDTYSNPFFESSWTELSPTVDVLRNASIAAKIVGAGYLSISIVPFLLNLDITDGVGLSNIKI